MTLWAVLFWLAVWQAAGMAVGDTIFFVTPAQVFLRLFTLAAEPSFWQSLLYSFLRIVLGFLAAAACGSLLAVLAASGRRIRELLAPLMRTIRTVPVVSFIILALILFTSENLSILISFLMGLPVMYEGVLAGMTHTDGKLREMADVFRIPSSRRIRYIDIPQVIPYFRSAAATACGLCWKAGTAAEVIGIPTGSIGEKLQQAKIYLETPDLFAWTLMIVALSLLTEKLFLSAADAAEKAALRMPEAAPAGREQVLSGTDPCAEEPLPAGGRAGSRVPEAPADICFNNVCRSYGTEEVLRNFTDVFPAGQVTGIMAPSGTGKTTLLRIAAGLEKPDSGTVSGTDGRLAAVFQENRLCEYLTAEANIRLVRPDLTEKAVRKAMADFGLNDCAGKNVSAFSGGMKRRTTILRALLSEWDILLLDEPFTGLDERTGAAVIAETRSYCRGRTVIFVTHDPEECAAMGVTHRAEIRKGEEEQA